MNYFNTLCFLSITILCAMLIACRSEKDSGAEEIALDFPGTPCELLNETLVRQTFGLPGDLSFDITDEYDICMYGWASENASSFYSLSLNFAPGGRRSEESVQAAWKSQNEGVYKDKDMQKVAGVGKQATWSSLGNGQLRVLAKGYIFYVTLSIYPDKEAMETKERIEKASIIAKEIIRKF